MTTPPDLRGPESEAYLRTAFLERIAHELRGPAGVTRGALDEIERSLGPQAAEFKNFFAMARRGISRILRSADRLQWTAHMQTHPDAAVMATVDLRDLAAQAARAAEEIEARRSVRVELVSGEQPCLVSADTQWLAMAITEIVGNAIRYARAVVLVETRSADAEANVIVLDDGPGFAGPPPRRFEPPFPRRGLGLSLPLVSDIVQAHAGTVSFQDRKAEGPESGTRVLVALKLHSSGG